MSVELDPAELGFRRPFTHEVSETLHLRNRNDKPVAFKVKTTAPKQYCVRPNSGRIEPGQSMEVQVLLQAMKEDPPLDAKCRDKFLVQSVGISPELESENISSIWSAVEKAGKEGIKERKIRVSFLPAAGGVNGASHDEAAASPVAAGFGSPHHDSQDFNTPSRGGAGESLTGSIAGTTVAASSAISDTASTTAEALKQQLEAAKVQIAQLTEQIQDSAGLRQRKVGTSASDGPKATGTATASKPAPSGGVSVQVVAILCLLSFLLAYFFF